jgi:DNA polymerase (family 10)
MPKLHAISNQDIARILGDIAAYLAMQAVPFKPRAYERAAETISELEDEVARAYEKGGVKALKEIPGVGIAIAEKMEELFKTGKLKYYEQLKKEVPVDLAGLRAIEGLGPKSIAKLYAKLGIKNLKDLERAAKAGKIAKLEGFGEKSEENFLKSIEFHKSGGGRRLLMHAMSEVRELEVALGKHPAVLRLIVAGSARRKKETIGDVDILVVSKKPAAVMDAFVKLPGVMRVFAHGPTKSSILLSSGLQADLRVVEKGSCGAALNYFTGSKDHNVALRGLAMKKGYTLNEYGLSRVTSDKRRGTRIAGETEEGIYKKLGLAYIEPELRENTGEIEAARAGKLPDLVGYGDLKGDLQVQTDWTDGTSSIEAMAEAAAERKLEYIAITDHTKHLTVANGLDEKRIMKQWTEIDKVNKGFKVRGVRFEVLKGTECDILKDGSLDMPDSTLSKLDVVGVSVHSHFNLPRKEQTERIIRAMENKHVDILFHPTGRIVGKRPPYDVDVEALINAAKRTGVVMEANALERLDLKDEHIRMCVEQGVKIAIDSDAHRTEHFDALEFGIAQARRGWAEKKDVINAWPVEKMKKMLR